MNSNTSTAESNLITSIETIVAIILKETRIEKRIHQAQLADYLSKSASSLAKIENFQTSIGIDSLYAMCQALNVIGSSVLAAAERYAQLLNSSGWIVVRSKPEEDRLAKEALAYYNSPGFKRRTSSPMTLVMNNILSGPTYWQGGAVTMPDVFNFVLHVDFRSSQLNPNFPPAFGSTI